MMTPRWRGIALALVAMAAVGGVLAPLALWSVGEQWFPPALLPQVFGLRGFREVARSGALSAAGASLGVASSTAILALLLAYPAGRALGLGPFRGRATLQTWLLLPALFPPTAAALGLHSGFIHLGLADTVGGVVLAHLVPALPYAVAVLTATFASFDIRYEEVSRNLGAGALRVFFTVTLPLTWPGLLVATLFAFLVSWSQYVLTLVVGGGVVITLPVLLFGLASGGDLHLTGAACVTFLVPVLLLLPVAARALTGTVAGGQR